MERPDPARKLSANQYDIYHCCVYDKKTPDDGQRNFPKHVEFYSKNKFEELVHLVGFIISIRTFRGHLTRKRTELQLRPDPARKLSANPYDIYYRCVYS